MKVTVWLELQNWHGAIFSVLFTVFPTLAILFVLQDENRIQQ